MGRQEDRLAVLARLGHAFAEDALHERIEAGGRFVEEEKVGARHETSDEEDLLAVPLRASPHLLGVIELEPLDQQIPVGSIDPALHSTQEVDCLGAREGGPQVDLAWHVPECGGGPRRGRRGSRDQRSPLARRSVG